jgi:hypothetical protein
MILIDVKQCTQEQVVAVLVYNNKRSTYLYNCTVGTVTQVDCIVCRRVECLLNESKSNQNRIKFLAVLSSSNFSCSFMDLQPLVVECMINGRVVSI